MIKWNTVFILTVWRLKEEAHIFILLIHSFIIMSLKRLFIIYVMKKLHCLVSLFWDSYNLIYCQNWYGPFFNCSFCSFKAFADVSPGFTRNASWPQCTLRVNPNCRAPLAADAQCHFRERFIPRLIEPHFRASGTAASRAESSVNTEPDTRHVQWRVHNTLRMQWRVHDTLHMQWRVHNTLRMQWRVHDTLHM